MTTATVILGTFVVLCCATVFLLVNRAPEVGSAPERSMGVVAADGECVAAIFVRSDDTAATPEDALEASISDHAPVSRRDVSTREVRFEHREGDRLDTAYRVMRVKDAGWRLSELQRSYPCDRLDDAVPFGDRN